MAWEQLDTSVLEMHRAALQLEALVDDGSSPYMATVAYMKQTSTSSLLLTSQSSIVYVYGVRGNSFESAGSLYADAAANAAVELVEPEVGLGSGTSDYIQFVPASVPTTPREALTAEVGLDPVTMPLVDTAIVEQPAAVEYTYLDESGALVSSGTDITVNCLLKDPHVLRVNIPGWPFMMVLTRIRGQESPPENVISSTLSDIVCYLSTDPSFATVTGPYRLVDDLDSVPSEALVDVDGDALELEDGEYVRGWCSVPGAMFDGSLYLYYVLESRENTGDGSFPDDATWTDDHAIKRGIACKRIRMAEIQRLIDEGWTDPSTWDANPTEATAQGELLGMVRVWIASKLFPYVTAFEEEYPGAYIADPVPVCYNDFTSLFFSAITDNKAEDPTYTVYRGAGLFRASAIETGVLLATQGLLGPNFPSARTFSVYGLDFLLRPVEGSTRQSPDQIVASVEFDYLDPDPFRTRQGVWGVQAGGGGEITHLFTGLDEDVLINYRDMWTV